MIKHLVNVDRPGRVFNCKTVSCTVYQNCKLKQIYLQWQDVISSRQNRVINQLVSTAAHVEPAFY